jgi:hypothetical protein
MRTGGGGTRPADAGQATASCSGGHPPAAAGAAADTNRPDTNRPDTDLVDTDRGSGSSSGQPRRPRCPVLQPPRHRPRCPAAAGRRRIRSRRCGATPGPRRSELLACFARLRWSSGQVDAASGERLSGCLDTGGGLPNTGSPHAPALRTPATAAGRGDTAAAATLDSRQQDRPPPGNGVRPERDLTGRHRPARPADRQIRRLVVNVHAVVLSAWRGPGGRGAAPGQNLTTLRGRPVQA